VNKTEYSLSEPWALERTFYWSNLPIKVLDLSKFKELKTIPSAVSEIKNLKLILPNNLSSMENPPMDICLKGPDLVLSYLKSSQERKMTMKKIEEARLTLRQADERKRMQMLDEEIKKLEDEENEEKKEKEEKEKEKEKENEKEELWKKISAMQQLIATMEEEKVRMAAREAGLSKEVAQLREENSKLKSEIVALKQNNVK
jgi:flagellar biosynthesis GTPase FlhF